MDKRKGMIPLKEWNKLQKSKRYPRLNDDGIECPNCKAKVWDRKTFIIDTGNNVQRVVECQVCEHVDTRELQLNEGNLENRDEGLPSKPAFYIRSSAPLNMASALLLLGSFIAVLTIVWTITNAIQQNLRTEVRNERNERINQFNRLDRRVNECCKGRW